MAEDNNEFLRDQVQRLTSALSRYQHSDATIVNQDTVPLQNSHSPLVDNKKLLLPLLNEYDHVINDLSHQNNLYKSELEALNVRVREIVEENTQLHSKLSTMSTIAGDDRVPSQTKDNTDVDILTKERGSYLQFWRQSSTELQEIRRTDTDKTKELNSYKSQLSIAQKSLASCKESVEELTGRYHQLDMQYQHSLQSTQSLEKELLSLQQQLSHSKSDLKAAQTKNSDLNQLLIESNFKLKQLEVEKTATTGNGQSVDHSMRLLVNSKSELQAKLIATQHEHAALQSKSTEIQARNTQLENELEALLERETRASIEVKESMEMVQTALMQKEQLEVREQQNMQEIKRLQKSMSILLEEAGVRTKKEVETVREECNKNIDKMAIEIHKLEKECGERKGQLDQALREKSSLQAELEKTLSQVPLEQGRVKDLLQELQRKLTYSEKAFDEASRKMKEMSLLKKTLESRLRESKEQSDELLVELQAVRREWEAETHQLREELTRLTRENNQAHEELYSVKRKLKATVTQCEQKVVVAHEERESKEKELFAKLRQTEEVNLQRQRELQELITSQQQRLVRWKEDADKLKDVFEATVRQLQADCHQLTKRNKQVAAKLAHQEQLNHSLTANCQNLEHKAARLSTKLYEAESSVEQASNQVSALLSREKQLLSDKRSLQQDMDRLRLLMSRAMTDNRHQVHQYGTQSLLGHRDGSGSMYADPISLSQHTVAPTRTVK